MGSIFGAGNLLSGNASVANFQPPPPSTAIPADPTTGSTSVSFIVLLLLRPGITDLGSGVYWYTLILVYTYVRYLFSYLLHDLVDKSGGRGGVLLWDRGEDLVVDQPHNLEPGDLQAPLVDGYGDGLHHVGGPALDGCVQCLPGVLEVQAPTPELGVAVAPPAVEAGDGVLAPPRDAGVRLEERLPELLFHLGLGVVLLEDLPGLLCEALEPLPVEEPEDQTLGELALLGGDVLAGYAEHVGRYRAVDVLPGDELLAEVLVAGEGG